MQNVLVQKRKIRNVVVEVEVGEVGATKTVHVPPSGLRENGVGLGLTRYYLGGKTLKIPRTEKHA